mgnify:CR=1 FL=1
MLSATVGLTPLLASGLLLRNPWLSDLSEPTTAADFRAETAS